MQDEDAIRRRLKRARAMAEAQDHIYDRGYADALAWVLGERAGRYGAGDWTAEPDA